MKCENCGAEYRMKDVCCPFCQSENPVLAEIRKEQILKGYDKELQRMRNTVPDKTMEKWTWRLVAVCGILAGVALLAGIILAICAPIKARWDYQRHQRHEQRLEEMLAGDDIEGIYQYMNKERLYTYDFPKFREIYNVYMQYTLYQSGKESLENYKEDIYRETYDKARMREETEKACRSLMEHAGEILQLCRQYGSDNILYGDETLFEAYYEMVCGELRGMGISDQQLEWMSAKRENMEDDPLLQQIVELAADVYMGHCYPE